MSIFNRFQTFATNGTVDAASLHNLIDATTIRQGLITSNANITSVGTNYKLLIADTTNANANPNAVTVYDLFQDALTAGTYTNANISEALTYGTATGTRLVSTNATITTGTITTGVIPTLTAGTTTSTAATITSGTITTLNSTTGTIATLNSTTGTIATLNSTTGTIGNFSTTLTGDFTISSGTGTLGTTGVTAGTYGSASAIPFLTVDAKGRITSATSGTLTPPAGSVVQVVRAETSANTSGNTAIPFDNTIPQNTEGFEVLTCTITPVFATSKLYIVSTIYAGESSNLSDDLAAALFRDSTADAFAVSTGLWAGGPDSGAPLYTSAYINSNSTSPTTIKARIGVSAGGGATVVLNIGTGFHRSFPVYGGAYFSSITIMEIMQ